MRFFMLTLILSSLTVFDLAALTSADDNATATADNAVFILKQCRQCPSSKQEEFPDNDFFDPAEVEERDGESASPCINLSFRHFLPGTGQFVSENTLRSSLAPEENTISDHFNLIIRTSILRL